MITDITISFKKFTQLLRNGKLIKGKRLQCLQYYTVALTIAKIICNEFWMYFAWATIGKLAKLIRDKSYLQSPWLLLCNTPIVSP